MPGTGIKCAAGTVAHNFWSHVWAGERIKLFCPVLLLRKIAGVEQVGIPAILRIAQTTSQKKQQKANQNTTAHYFAPIIRPGNARKIGKMSQDRFLPPQNDRSVH